MEGSEEEVGECDVEMNQNTNHSRRTHHPPRCHRWSPRRRTRHSPHFSAPTGRQHQAGKRQQPLQQQNNAFRPCLNPTRKFASWLYVSFLGFTSTQVAANPLFSYGSLPHLFKLCPDDRCNDGLSLGCTLICITLSSTSKANERKQFPLVFIVERCTEQSRLGRLQ